jgi:tetratricopeptide (TPR) repeat protein
MLSHRSLYALALCGACCAAGCQTPPGFFNFKFWNSSASRDLKDPEKLHLTYAQYSEQNGDFDTARTSYETALEQNEQSFDAVLGLARLDLLSGKTPQAERNFLKAFEMAPTNEVAIEALGQFYLTQDRFVEAAQYLQRGLDLAPGNRRLRYRMALALARQGDIPAAESHFIQAVGEAEADYNIGLILYERGEVGPAEQRFLQAVLKKPTLAQAQHWLDTVRQERDPQNMIARRNAATGQQSAETSQQQPPLQIAQAPAGSDASVRGNAPQEQRPLLDPRTLNATQLEQLENSMTPEERTAFRASLQSGGTVLQ